MTPVLGALLGRFKQDDAAPAPLAGKSTLNRLEHAAADAAGGSYHKIGHEAAAIEAVFVDLFLDAFGVKPPGEIILDLDATDDPIHEHQEGRFFHGSHGDFGVKLSSYGIMGARSGGCSGSKSKPVA
jgi:hypothetical protein